MIAYFDTSAVVPLVVDEPGSAVAARLWDEADRVVSVRLVYVEGRAALAQARRLGRLDHRQLGAAVAALGSLYEQVDRVEVDERLVRRGGELAERHALRGYDAIHLAAAERVREEDTVVVGGDADLVAAARASGIAVARTTGGAEHGPGGPGR